MEKQELTIKKELPRILVISSFVAIVFILALLPFIAWLLEYKDTISAPLTITSETTPVDVFAKTAGELLFLVENGANVQENTTLAVIKNTAELTDVEILKGKLAQENKEEIAIAKDFCEFKHLQVGQIKPALVELIKAVEARETFLKTDQHNALINSRQEQIALYEARKALLHRKSGFIQEDKAYAEKFADIDKKLLAEDVIAAREYDKSNREKIGKEIAAVNNATLLNTLDIQIKLLQQERIEIRSQFQATKLKLNNDIKAVLQLLRSDLAKWELTYLIKANIAGICVYKDYLNDYRFVEAEEKVFSILPEKNSAYFGLVKLPMAGASKVIEGQEVYVKLNNYPFMEFGVLKGKVKHISPLPFDNQYNVQVYFPKGFVSTYGKKLATAPLMYGIAEVIVEKKSLYNRITEQIKSVRLNR